MASHRGGHMQLIVGPMFAGKTSELVRRIRRYSHAQHRCLIIKYAKDTRYSDTCVATHDRQTLSAVSCERLSEVAAEARAYDVIGIDEGQFFPDLLEFSDRSACEGKVIIIAALDGTFQRLPFGSVCELLSRAEHVTKLTAVCSICHGDAAFSKRITDDQEVEVIGGSDKYIPVCRACFYTDRKSHRAASGDSACKPIDPASPPRSTSSSAPASPTLSAGSDDAMDLRARGPNTLGPRLSPGVPSSVF